MKKKKKSSLLKEKIICTNCNFCCETPQKFYWQIYMKDSKNHTIYIYNIFFSSNLRVVLHRDFYFLICLNKYEMFNISVSECFLFR